MNLWEYIKSEIAVVKAAPLSFIGLVVASVGAGIGIAAWHFSERLEAQQGQIQRYRVALGIDKGGRNALAELTNMELQAKALNIGGQARALCFSFQNREEKLKTGKVNQTKKEEQALFEQDLSLMKEVGQEFDHDLKSDFLNINNELLRRLDRKAVSGVVRGPIFSDAETGTPIGMASLTPSQLVAPFLCTYADQVEQMAKLLPK